MLNENQIDILLPLFKHTESNWEDVARLLLKYGSIIVSKNTCRWYGGIGNFIEVNSIHYGYDVYKYTFKFDDFLDSDYGNEYMKNMINKREQTINDCERYIAEIEELFNQQFGV